LGSSFSEIIVYRPFVECYFRGKLLFNNWLVLFYFGCPLLFAAECNHGQLRPFDICFVNLFYFIFFLLSIRGVDKFFKTLAILASIGIFTRQIRKQLAKNIERGSQGKKKPCQTGEWV
jgi:hypothetical protein